MNKLSQIVAHALIACALIACGGAPFTSSEESTPLASAGAPAIAETTTAPPAAEPTTAPPAAEPTTAPPAPAICRTPAGTALASSTYPGDPASFSLDSSSDTCWTAAQPREIGDWFEVDLLAPAQISALALSSGDMTEATTALELTIDGASLPSTATQSSDGKTVTLAFPAVTATRIRVTLSAPTPHAWWSIDTFQICGAQ